MNISEIESKLGKLVYVHALQHDSVTVTHACNELGLQRIEVLPIIDELMKKGALEPIEHSHQHRYRAC